MISDEMITEDPRRDDLRAFQTLMVPDAPNAIWDVFTWHQCNQDLSDSIKATAKVSWYTQHNSAPLNCGVPYADTD